MNQAVATESWQVSLYKQREKLGRLLHGPMRCLAECCTAAWHGREALNGVLHEHFGSIPHCTHLFALDPGGVQLSDNVNHEGVVPGYFGRDRSARPYMQEAMPPWGFLLSDAYVSLHNRRPSIAAVQEVHREGSLLGYLGAEFDLRALPGLPEPYPEPGGWRQIKGDPAIRGTLFQQTRVESPMDRSLEQALSILEELITQHGVFQCQVHFSSSQATIWLDDDPYRYRILDREAIVDPDICLLYPVRPYPRDADIPAGEIRRILDTMRTLRLADETLYLRTASINLYNGMVSLTFSCDGSHYMSWRELLEKDVVFWLGSAEGEAAPGAC